MSCSGTWLTFPCHPYPYSTLFPSSSNLTVLPASYLSSPKFVISNSSIVVVIVTLLVMLSARHSFKNLLSVFSLIHSDATLVSLHNTYIILIISWDRPFDSSNSHLGMDSEFFPLDSPMSPSLIQNKSFPGEANLYFAQFDIKCKL